MHPDGVHPRSQLEDSVPWHMTSAPTSRVHCEAIAFQTPVAVPGQSEVGWQPSGYNWTHAATVILDAAARSMTLQPEGRCVPAMRKPSTMSAIPNLVFILCSYVASLERHSG